MKVNEFEHDHTNLGTPIKAGIPQKFDIFASYFVLSLG